jgi:hypothetical protein
LTIWLSVTGTSTILPGHLEIYRYRSSVDEGVIGVRIMATVKVPKNAANHDSQRRDDADRDGDRMSA